MQLVIANVLNKNHERTSEFFASKNYKDFRHDMAFLDIKRPPFLELSFKCCGYGYFPSFKQRMLKNFMEYFEEALKECTELTTLKIIFNGFDVNDNSIHKICEAIRGVIAQKKLRTLWIHTTNLRQCSKQDFDEIFTLIDNAGVQITCEEISIQMADWEFTDGYPAYQELVSSFGKFYENIVESLKFKKFRLQISSWYMKQKEAYNFLKDTLSIEAIEKAFVIPRADNQPNSQDNNQEEDNTSKALRYFLQNMDRKYLQPNYQFKRSHQSYNEEDKEKHNEMLEKMVQYEQEISKKLVKYPNEYIQQLRVEEFHKQMTTFLGGLLYKLPYIQEYHIDLRNWHPMFGMSNLKKQLDTKVNSKQEFSLIRRSLGLASKSIGKIPLEGEEVGLKTIYTM